MQNGASKLLEAAFLTPKEAAAYLRINVHTMYAFMRKSRAKGGPPVQKFSGNCYRLPTQEFIEWANSKREK